MIAALHMVDAPETANVVEGEPSTGVEIPPSPKMRMFKCFWTRLSDRETPGHPQMHDQLLLTGKVEEQVLPPAANLRGSPHRQTPDSRRELGSDQCDPASTISRSHHTRFKLATDRLHLRKFRHVGTLLPQGPGASACVSVAAAKLTNVRS